MNSQRRFLVTGITSIHGWPIFRHWQELYPGQVLGLKNKFAKEPAASDGVIAVNIEDGTAVRKICREFCPTDIIHCAGLCDLDVGEDYPERAKALNVHGTFNICDEATACRMVYLSYDLVFSGKNKHAGGYTEEDLPDPLTVVGKTVVEAEKIIAATIREHLVIRLALPMGPSLQGNKGAVDWMAWRFSNDRRVTLLYDEVRSTINTDDIGPAVYALMEAGCRGIINLGSPYKVSLHGIGTRLVAARGYAPHLLEGKFRTEFPPSPPRMGDVSLDSQKAYRILGWTPQAWVI
jgi:dTDP-4-dehydrorhamnose reductase